MQPLIRTKIREFDPHFKEVGTQGLFSLPQKKKEHILTKNQSDGAFTAGREVHLWVCQCVGRMCLQPTGKGDYYIDAALTAQKNSQMTSISLQQQVDRELSYWLMTHQKQFYPRALATADNRDGDIIVSAVPQSKMEQV